MTNRTTARRATFRWLQRLFFAAGFLILGYCGADWLNSRLHQYQGNLDLDRMLNHHAVVPDSKIPDGGLIGRVEIPKLHLSAVIFQGSNSTILDQGVGHVDSTALPGQPGNVVLAAHRDTFFRVLRNIQTGDMVMVTTDSGPRAYEVESTEVVKPTEVSVLNPTAEPTLTLITCYPFYYVGHAPKRFIVRAREEDETARNFYSGEQTQSRPAPEETTNLSYLFKALR